MLYSKTGNWFSEAPQRARANISALMIRSEITREIISTYCKVAKEHGEPGFILSKHREYAVNPCAEISLTTWMLGSDGIRRRCFDFCNLSEIAVPTVLRNAVEGKEKEEFLEACRNASIIGSIQCSYSNIPFVNPGTKFRVQRDRLLGVSLTGIMQAHEFIMDKELLRDGAKTIQETNIMMAKLLDINPACRLTCVKPSGTLSIVAGLSGCGIHPVHAKQYIRHVQVSNSDELGAFYSAKRPGSIETSVWAKDTNVIAFPINVIGENLRTKQNISAIQLLESAKFVQTYWVRPGTVLEHHGEDTRGLFNNSVSLTVNVKDHEWDSVAKYIFENREYFTGISLLSSSGDISFPQCPFIRVFTAEELIHDFGIAAFFASGLIVDVQRSFDSLHMACNAVIFGMPPIEDESKRSHEERETYNSKIIAVSRIKKFATKYFKGNNARCIECLKRVDNVHRFASLTRECKESGAIDWAAVEIENTEQFVEKQEDNKKIVVCSGGSCVLQRV